MSEQVQWKEPIQRVRSASVYRRTLTFAYSLRFASLAFGICFNKSRRSRVYLSFGAVRRVYQEALIGNDTKKLIMVKAREIRRLQLKVDDPRATKSILKLDAAQQAARQEFLSELENRNLREIEIDCPVCGAETYIPFASRDRLGIPVTTVVCAECPTLYSRWRLDDKSLDAFYRRFYRRIYTRSESPSLFFEGQVASGQKILDFLLANGRLEKPISESVILEIGCGAGGVLYPFHLEGARVVGVDFDVDYLEAGRSQGLDLREGSYEEVADAGPFDIIILKDVLEHVADLHKILVQLRGLLNDSGRIFIQVPGFESLELLGYRSDFLRYLQNAHLVHFSEPGLLYLFGSAGFSTVSSSKYVKAVFAKVAPIEVFVPLSKPSNELALRTIERTIARRHRAYARQAIHEVTPKPLRDVAKQIISKLPNMRRMIGSDR